MLKENKRRRLSLKATSNSYHASAQVNGDASPFMQMPCVIGLPEVMIGP